MISFHVEPSPKDRRYTPPRPQAPQLRRQAEQLIEYERRLQAEFEPRVDSGYRPN